MPGGPLLTRSQLPHDLADRSTTPVASNRRPGRCRNRTGGTDHRTAGATFIVNGRPFNGTGAGFNELAKAGEPRLNAVETVGIVERPDQVALSRNRTHSQRRLSSSRPIRQSDDRRRRPLGRPLSTARLRDLSAAQSRQVTTGVGSDPARRSPAPLEVPVLRRPRRRRRVVRRPRLPEHGPRPADRHAPVPRPRRARRSPPAPPSRRSKSTSTGRRTPSDFLRLDLEDLPLPSFHRPDLDQLSGSTGWLALRRS